MNGTDLHYFEHEQPREIELRQEFAEALAAVAPDVERPDVEQGHAYRLRKLAANFIAQQKLWSARANREGDWRTQLDDSEEIRQLCKECAEAIQPFINRALVSAERHEALSNVCVHHQGET